MKKNQHNYNEVGSELIIENFDKFLIIARKFLKGKLAHLAEDAAQDSCLKCIEKMHMFSGSTEQFGGWVYRLVKHTCHDISRKKREETTSEGSFGNTNTFLFQTEPSDFSESRKKRKLTKSVIYDMKLRDRQLILMQDYFNMTGREISKHTGIPERNVTMYYHRAKQVLIARVNELYNL